MNIFSLEMFCFCVGVCLSGKRAKEVNKEVVVYLLKFSAV